MTFTLTVSADDLTALGAKAATGVLDLRIAAPILDAGTDRVKTGKPWRVTLDADGNTTSEVPTVPVGNALRIDSYVPGFQGRFYAADPGVATVSIVDLLQNHQVDPKTLEPLPSAPTVGAAIATAQAIAQGAQETAEQASSDAAAAKSTADAALPATELDTATSALLDDDASKISATIETVVMVRGLSMSNTPAGNTALIQAAVTKAESLGLDCVFPPMADTVDLAGGVTVTGGITIRCPKGSVRLRQTVFPSMIFDVIGPNVVIDGFSFYQDVALFAQGPSFTGTDRGGSPQYAYNAGVWAGADNVTVRNIYVEGLVAGVYFGSWDVTANAARSALLGCSVENLEVHNVVFGMVASGVSGFRYSGLSGDHYLPAGIGTPPHLVYFVDNRAPNVDVKGDACNSTDGQTSYAYQFKGVTGGEFSKHTARGTMGLLHTMGCSDLTFTDMAAFEDTWSTELAGSIEIEATNSNIVIDGLTMELSGTGKPFRTSATTSDSILRNATIISNHTVASTTGNSYDVDIEGTHNTADNVSVTNVGAAPWDASIGDWAGLNHIIRRPRTSGNKVGVTVRSRVGSAHTRIEDYDTAEMGSTLAQPLSVGSAATLAPRASFATRMGKNRLLAYDDGSLPAGAANTISTAPSGQSWVQQFGTWAADGSHIYATSGASATATLDLGTANVDFTAGLLYKNREALVLRVIDKNNLLAFRLNHTTNVLELVSFNTGAGTILTSTPVTVAIGRRYELRAMIFGLVVDVYLDGKWMFSYTLTGGDATKFVGTVHGLMSATGDPAGKFDNVMFRSLS